jgi:hypothetical protein
MTFRKTCIFIVQTNARQYNIYRYSISAATCFGAIRTIFEGVTAIHILKTQRSRGTQNCYNKNFSCTQ